MDRLILEDMIWPEVAEVLPEIKVALILSLIHICIQDGRVDRGRQDRLCAQ